MFFNSLIKTTAHKNWYCKLWSLEEEEEEGGEDEEEEGEELSLVSVGERELAGSGLCTAKAERRVESNMVRDLHKISLLLSPLLFPLSSASPSSFLSHLHKAAHLESLSLAETTWEHLLACFQVEQATVWWRDVFVGTVRYARACVHGVTQVTM